MEDVNAGVQSAAEKNSTALLAICPLVTATRPGCVFVAGPEMPLSSGRRGAKATLGAKSPGRPWAALSAAMPVAMTCRQAAAAAAAAAVATAATAVSIMEGLMHCGGLRRCVC